MDLGIFNDLIDKVKDSDLVQSFITELSNHLEKTNLKEGQEMTQKKSNELNSHREENALYQVVDFSSKGVYLRDVNTNKIFEERGIKLPLEKQGTTNRENRFDKGLEVQKSIFGDVIDKNYENSPENQVHIQKFLSDNCFGDYYTRNGLDVKTRELITFSILLSQGGCEPQLKGHIAGNVNVGNDKQTLLNTVTALLPYVGYPRSLNAIACINQVIPD